MGPYFAIEKHEDVFPEQSQTMEMTLKLIFSSSDQLSTRLITYIIIIITISSEKMMTIS